MIQIEIFIGALFAEIAGTISGFGSSSIFLPIANQFLDYRNAITLVAIYHIFGNVSRLSLFWRHWNSRIFILFGIPSIFATVLGVAMIPYFDVNLLKMILGIVLLFFAVFLLIDSKFNIKPTPFVGRVGGFLSWFFAGLIGTGWILRWAFLTVFNLPKEQYIATIASIALLVDITRIPLYFGQGFLDYQYILYIPILFIIAFIGSYIWKKIVNHLNQKILKQVILIWIMILSLLLAYQWLQAWI